MPKLRRLSGQDLIRALEKQFGFAVVRVKGSHHVLRRTVTITNPDGSTREEVQTVNIPVHGSTPLATGMLKRLHRDMQQYVSEAELNTVFYTD